MNRLILLFLLFSCFIPGLVADEGSPDHPTNPDEPAPWFEINKNLIYPSETHPTHADNDLPWFEIREI